MSYWKLFSLVMVFSALALIFGANATSLLAEENPTPTATTPFFIPVNDKSPLEWAKLLVDNIQPDNTEYRHDADLIIWAGINSAATYESRTDCSGLLMALLTQSYGLSTDDYVYWLYRSRPRAQDFYTAAVNQRGFIRFTNIDDVQPGDMIAILYPENQDKGNTGHLMLVIGLPVKLSLNRPIVKDFEQWAVTIIDSTATAHGQSDDRYLGKGKSRAGVGQGTIRLYVNANGKIMGYVWSTDPDYKFYGSFTHPLAIARLDLTFPRP
jgi:hypothetical protein